VTDNAEDFIARVNGVKAGEKVDLVLLRKGKKVEVKGVELPAARAR
jgi:S1-C subfamily serine protease